VATISQKTRNLSTIRAYETPMRQYNDGTQIDRLEKMHKTIPQLHDVVLLGSFFALNAS
jgi:hypothetical protein